MNCVHPSGSAVACGGFPSCSAASPGQMKIYFFFCVLRSEF